MNHMNSDKRTSILNVCDLRTAYCEYHICREAVQAEPALVLGQRFYSLAVVAGSRSDYLEKDPTRVCYE